MGRSRKQAPRRQYVPGPVVSVVKMNWIYDKCRIRCRNSANVKITHLGLRNEISPKTIDELNPVVRCVRKRNIADESGICGLMKSGSKTSIPETAPRISRAVGRLWEDYPLVG